MEKERVIEVRSYNTKCGIWTYFTADDGQIDLQKYDYLVIGTLESYYGMREYFGEEQLVPIYIEVEDGMRLERALLQGTTAEETQICGDVQTFFWQMQRIFSEENFEKSRHCKEILKI